MAVDYGREMSCTDSIHTGRFVSGALIVGQACYRRLRTPRGTLRDDPSYGLDLRQFIGSTDTRKLEASLPGRIRAELEKDERIESVDVDILTATTTSGDVSFAITIEAVTSLGPFTLQVLASSVTVELLGIE